MKAFVVVGMAFGDEGKGATTNFLVLKSGAKLVVRYNGGAQAAHNVVLEDGRHHTFCQFGSGTFIPNVKTHLSRFVLVNPITMLHEETYLQKLGVSDAFQRTSVDGKALIITSYHKALNRMKELVRGDLKHGSCGQGIGATRKFHLKYSELALFAKDLKDYNQTRTKLQVIRDVCLDSYKRLVGEYSREIFDFKEEQEDLWEEETRKIIGLLEQDVMVNKYSHWVKKVKIVDSLMDVYPMTPVVFEGAQGVLLDETFGFQPHTTWTNTTCENALTLIKEISPTAMVSRVGVFRKYFTRHGAGPFATEDKGLNQYCPEPHNKTEIYQDHFRVGHFDMDLAKYALEVCPVDSLAINHMDVQIPGLLVKVNKGDTIFMKSEDNFLKTIEEHTKVPIEILGFGPTAAHRRLLKP